MEGLKIQKEIRDNCEELRDSLVDISKWEKEMKEKEKKLLANSENEKIPAVRSAKPQLFRTEGNFSAIEKGSSTPPQKNESIENDALKKRADECKDKGNYYVKIGDYEQAIYCYTDAMNNFNNNPIFYTNRALCYLKLERYEECIEDCNMALRLNKKTVKAFYRRMQAHESLGENNKALQDCRKILEIEPKNTEANKSLERITRRLQKAVNRDQYKEVPPGPRFTELTSNMKVINTINKPPHLRSKKALKRISVGETVESPVSSIKDTKNVENSSIAYSHISDEVIDKLFNSNEYANYKQVHKKQKPAPVPVVTNENAVKKPQTLPSVPQTTGQFYATWKELSRENKYLYLRNIEPSNINKILGAGLDSETLGDILGIMSEYYIKNKEDVHKLLFELSKHSEVTILSLFFSDQDQSVLKKLVTYMLDRKDSEDDINAIKLKFKIA